MEDIVRMGRMGNIRRIVMCAALAGALAPLAPFACSAPGTDAGGTLPTGTADASGPPAPLSLPFAVSADFQPTGFMGDSTTDFNGITMSSECPARMSGAVGDCYSASWTPVIATGNSSAWVGVYWQYPGNNWGGVEGRPIQAGASKVTFAAMADLSDGGSPLQVQFIAGGIKPSADAGLEYADSFKATTTVTLTGEWATYSIPLTGQQYTDVIGAFAWSITTYSASPITFYVDDIQWEP